MKIHLGDISVFKYFIEALKVVNEEQTLTFTENGIGAMTMDPSHVAMVKAEMKKTEGFTLEDFAKEETTVCLNIAEVHKVVDRLEKKEKVEIEYDEESNKFVILATRSGQTRRFSLYVMEPLDEELPEPKINFTHSARIAGDAINQAMKDAGLWSEHVAFKGEKEAMTVSNSGDMGDFQVKWKPSSEDMLEWEAEDDDEASATYTLSYLQSIIGVAKKDAEVFKLSWTNDMPIKIEVEHPTIEIEYYLAPCIGV